MFLQNKFFTIVPLVLALVSVGLSACSTITPLQPTRLPHLTGPAPSSAKTQTAPPKMEPTQTMDSTSTDTTLPSATPVDLSNVTDASMAADRLNAFKATRTLVTSLSHASQQEIVKTLLDKWLAYYTGDQVDAYLRLKQYKINEVGAIKGYCPPPDKNTRKFAAGVRFSIQTVTPHPGDWVVLPGDITFGDENWINDFAPYVSIAENNGIYTLGVEGSIPCS